MYLSRSILLLFMLRANGLRSLCQRYGCANKETGTRVVVSIYVILMRIKYHHEHNNKISAYTRLIIFTNNIKDCRRDHLRLIKSDNPRFVCRCRYRSITLINYYYYHFQIYSLHLLNK